MWAIIGGTGFEKFRGFQILDALEQETPFGLASSGAARAKLEDHEVLFISRHGQHHELSPTEVNYRANIYLLKKAGASKILAFSSVGSLREALKPGDLVVPTQFIDRTKGIRAHTFTGDGLVSHVSLAEPTSSELVSKLKTFSPKFDFGTHFETTHVTIEGPAYSTKAEAKFHQLIGADTVGMTSFPEYALAREAGICYLPCLFVTDYDCWREGHEFVTAAQVASVISSNRARAFEVMSRLIPATHDILPNGCPELGLRSGLTSRSNTLRFEWA